MSKWTVLDNPLTVGEVVRHSGRPAVQRGAPQVLCGHHLPRRRFHERRPPQKDRPVAFDDHGFVSHGGDVSAPRGAAPQDQRDLRDIVLGHLCLVVEDAPEVVAVGEDVSLARQVGACVRGMTASLKYNKA